MTTVVPLARETYERREEQIFRDWARRNLMQVEASVYNAATAAQAITDIWAFGNLPEYADDTAAGVGGLTQGKFYRTATGVLMVKL
jgi:hypothetical protein